jgi:putative ABC transport system permease protein
MSATLPRGRAAVVSSAGDVARLAIESIRSEPARSALAIVGIVIGIVTVVLVASTLVGLRNSVAVLFRELGSDNIFAFHRDGDPYSPSTERDARRRTLSPVFAGQIERLASAVRDVGVQLLVPAATGTRVLTARAGGNESDTVLIEGVSPNFFDVTGAEFASGRPFTDVEDRAGAHVAVLGASVARALFGPVSPLERSFLLGGERYFVVGVLEKRRGTFFGENRNDNVVSVPLGTARRRFPEAEQTVLYIRARAGQVDAARVEAETILRVLRGLGPGDPNDFSLSTADQIIGQFDRIGARIFLVTVALSAVSLIIGGIGIANVMIISVTERTREIGIRLAVGARRSEVLRQFLFEAGLLAGCGGLIGVGVALAIGLLASLLAPGFPAMPPPWAIAAGLFSAVLVGIVAGYWPAYRAAGLDPVEALRYE